MLSVWVGGKQVTHNAAVQYGAFAVGKYGIGGRGDGSSTSATLRGVALPSTGNVTHIAAIKVGTVGSQRIICTSDLSTASSLNFRLNTTSIGWSTSTAGSLANITSAVSANEECVVALTYSGQSNPVTGAKNGVILTATTATATAASNSTGSPTLGCNSFGQYYDGDLYLWAAWERVLSNAELTSITANPWQIFAP